MKVTRGMVTLLVLFTLISACSSKPSNKEFHQAAEGDIPNIVSRNHGTSTPINGRLYRFENPAWVGINYYVVGDVEPNDQEMYPYRAAVYNINYITNPRFGTPQAEIDAFADRLMKSDQSQLLNMCRQFTSNDRVARDVAIAGMSGCNVARYDYLWGKNTKSWQRDYPQY